MSYNLEAVAPQAECFLVSQQMLMVFLLMVCLLNALNFHTFCGFIKKKHVFISVTTIGVDGEGCGNAYLRLASALSPTGRLESSGSTFVL